ncbi:hypothetical protein OIU77_001816 [Salix suchowensis]|uniref:Uncharacterized protein n=1 Tax=Salix suchowensis TaxID=1278906 RepID=A0ABQ9B4W7_9ROSI|nr:hypothetical protein OIU77_001816 [Salix suchowensis]
MADEPSPTRWSFQFGRKKAAAEAAQTSSESQQNGQTTAVASNGNGYVKNPSDMAIYEQYRNQDRSSNGVLSNGINEMSPKPLLPAFDSAETRSLAESLCRDIIRGSPDVKGESIKGLENAKRLLKEAVVMPIKCR